MQSYRTISRVLMLAVLGIAMPACEDRRVSPLEPGDEARLLLDGEGGFTTIDGVEFYVYQGGYYPTSNVSASIWDAKTTGDVWPYGGSVTAFFDFRGHGATQSTTWKLEQLSSGAHIDGGTAENFGSHTGLALSPFKKRYSGSFAIRHPYECDLKLSASSAHSAWWIGLAVTASSPYISPGRYGLKHAYSKMDDRKRPCGWTDEVGDDGDPGDGGCGDDWCDEPDDGTCTECQQWLHYSTSGTYLYDEWECNERSASYCQMLMS